MQSQYSIIFGTRPEYLKLKCIIDEFKTRNLNHQVVQVLQHENLVINDDFIKLDISNKIDERLSNIGSEILLKLPKIIDKSTHIIVQGDTATAFYSALTGFQMHKKIIHVEAGLRTYDLDKPFPEESYRQMISRMASIHFTPHEDSLRLLTNEKVSGVMYNVGNSILDLISSYNLKCSMEQIVIITFHRRENWNKIEDLLIGLEKLINKATPHMTYLWYLHPNPELQKKVTAISNKQIHLMQPCEHKEFTQQLARCNFIITDSGGIQEEASFLGKHCIVLRSSTERSHIPKEYITILEDYTLLGEVYENIPTYHLPQCTVYGNGNTSKNILDYIEQLK